jgi:regulatory protein
MPTVTRLEAQPRRPERVNVYLDGSFAFSLALPVAATLRPGQALDAAGIAQLQGEDAYRQALDRALGYLGRRPRSRRELERYLAGKEVVAPTAARVLARLEELGLVDDAQFAAWWVDNRLRHRPRGAQALRHELSAHGVDRPAQDEAVRGVDEAELARTLALAQARRYRGLPRDVFQRRLGGLLTRRGFGYAVVRMAVAAAWAAEGETDPGEPVDPDAY